MTLKLIIQIPCYNEAESLPHTLRDLPREVGGFNVVEWLVVDDGSKDGTAAIARDNGVNHIVSFSRNLGLARSFVVGLEACIQLGADVIVNTDADNQYRGADIQNLVTPILEGRADIVVGERPIETIKSFSWTKKFLQRLGSAVVRLISNTDVHDAPSGFRAFSRDAALRLNVFSTYTYTLETIIQAGQKDMTILSVPVGVNEGLRPSRLVKSRFSYVLRSMITIARVFVLYRPFRSFMVVGACVFTLGFLIGARFLYYYFSGDGDGHVQSLILASILLGVGFQTMLAAFLADILAVNRRLLEDIRYRQRRDESGSGQDDRQSDPSEKPRA